jgi:hypothetical protein
MTDAEAIRIMREHVERLFPKKCPNCQRSFVTLREYVLATKPLGATLSYDAEAGDWNPAEPVGTTAMANCPCGTTLTLTSDGISLMKMWRLLNWARVERKRRGIKQDQLLTYIRGEIRKQVLSEAEP